MDISKVPFMTVFPMPVTEIKFAPFNPPTRTTAASLEDLLQSVLEFGVIEPVKLSRDGMLGDGHRRVSCAKQAGITQVPAIRYDMRIEELFSLNGYSLAIRPLGWFQTYMAGNHNVPLSTKRRIENLIEVVGLEGAAKLAATNVSPHIYSMATMIANYCETDSLDFKRRAVWWMVDNRQQFVVRRAIGGGIDPEVLMSAIKKDRPIMQQWKIS